MSETRPRHFRSYVINLSVFMLSVVVLAVVANYFALRDAGRWQIDATKTRAYSLSEQSRRLLDDLDGEWTIGLVMVRDRIDEHVRRQVDEVLDRYVERSENIAVRVIDPTDPDSLLDYEQLLSELRMIYRDRVDAYERALDDGMAEYESLLLFAQEQSGGLEAMVEQLRQADPELAQSFAQRAGVFGLLADQGEQVTERVREARATNDEQPLPDYETARSILAAVLENWSAEMFEFARFFEQIARMQGLDESLRRHASNAVEAYDAHAQRLAERADPLKQLPDLELSRIGQALQGGDAAVIMGPDRAAVIESTQLFPGAVTSDRNEGGVRFDQRFRGEQVISATIRSLQYDTMPAAVFVHSQERSLLERDREQQTDLVAVQSLLESNRFEVREWIVGNSDRPSFPDDQPVVWVPIPPRSPTVEIDRRQQRLLETIDELIEDGEPVLLSLYPSLQPMYRQDDPWRGLVRRFGFDIDTSKAVFERVRVSADDTQTQRGQAIHRFEARHPVAAAIHGQPSFFPLPMPIRVLENDDDGGDADGGSRGTYDVLTHVRPGSNRVLADWTAEFVDRDLEEVGRPLERPRPLVVAGERRSPAGRGEQRYVIVGSGNWMLSNIADAAETIGGQRAARVYPGNAELMLASIAWLAGYDELIAPSPTSQEVARLDGVTPTVWRWWMVIALIFMPVGALAIGTVVWLVRRI